MTDTKYVRDAINQGIHMLRWRILTMIKVKRSKCQLIGSLSVVMPELTLALVNGAEILSNHSKLSIEEAIDVICDTAKQCYNEVKENEKL